MRTVRPLGDATWSVLAEPVVAVQAVRSYVLTEHRNAWHGTISARYRGPIALHVTLAEAQQMAEEWRTQGTVFKIYEVPSLRFVTGAESLVITDCHSTEPFSGCRLWSRSAGKLSPGVALAEALSPIWSIKEGGFGAAWDDLEPSEDSIITGVIAPEVATRPAGRSEMSDWRSYAQGVRYFLGWTSWPNDYSPASVHRIARRFRENGRGQH